MMSKELKELLSLHDPEFSLRVLNANMLSKYAKNVREYEPLISMHALTNPQIHPWLTEDFISLRTDMIDKNSYKIKEFTQAVNSQGKEVSFVRVEIYNDKTFIPESFTKVLVGPYRVNKIRENAG